MKYLTLAGLLFAIAACRANLAAEVPAGRSAAKGDAKVLRARAAAQVHFIAKVCALQDEEAAELTKTAGQESDRIALRLAEARSNRNWRTTEAPATLATELDHVLKGRLSKHAWTRLQAERQELAARLRHAAVELLVASLDELLLLEAEQRDELRKLLVEKWNGAWRPSDSWPTLLHADRTPWQTALMRGGIAVLALPRDDLGRVLRPAQLAVCKEAKSFALSVAEHPVVPVVRRRKQPLVDLSLESLRRSCELSQAERTRLLLAGKLDLDGQDRRTSPAGSAATAFVIDGLLPAGLSPEDLPTYVKACRNLSADGRQRYEDVARQRWRFHQSADLLSIVAACQRRAVMTIAQCDGLKQILRERLPEPGPETYDRRTTFATVARLPASQLEDVCDEFQIDLLVKCLAELREVVSVCEEGNSQ